MQSSQTFACFDFHADDYRVALPVASVSQVLDTTAALSTEAPHIRDLIGVELESHEGSSQREVRLIEFSGANAGIFLYVHAPIGVREYAVCDVVPNSASSAGKFGQAVIEDEGALVLLLDAAKVIEETRRLGLAARTRQE